MLKRSYLIYERNTAEQLPVAIAFSVRELAEWLGVSKRQAFRILCGDCEHPLYGVYVDVYCEEEEGGIYTATICPPSTVDSKAVI